MSFKKSNVFICPIHKVIYPYHEYTFEITSNIYEPEMYDNLLGFVTKIEENDLRNKSDI
jgi:hypothetical protein